MKRLLVLAALSLVSGRLPAAEPEFRVHAVALPGGGPDGILMDYLAFDARTGTVWAPAGNTGAVDVVDARTGKVRQVTGFVTQEMERRGRKRVVGPSAASVGEGVVYIGSRGDFTVCAVDEKTLARGACAKLDAMPDGVCYVAPTHEVWVTTPRDRSIRVLDDKTLAQKARLTFDGEPEGYAVDAKRGRFYTNLEDKDRTLAIDLKTRAVAATWAPGCGEDGPRGLALDEARGFLFVACTARAEVLDAGHDGAVLSKIDTGDGVDNLDYGGAKGWLYVGAAQAAKLTVASVDASGHLARVAEVATKPGARNGVVTGDGEVYLAHTAGSELLVVSPR